MLRWSNKTNASRFKITHQASTVAAVGNHGREKKGFVVAVALNHGRMGFMVEYCMLIQDLLQEVTVGGKMVWGMWDCLDTGVCKMD